MNLLTQEIISSLPKLQATVNEVDPLVRCKFFLPGTGWTWYVIEYDGEDLMYGYVVGLERELGYFSFKEIISVRGPMMLGVERDLYFTPKPLSKIR